MPFGKSADAQIHYSLEGPPAKPALILSNSLGADFSMWDPQIPEFSKSFRVLRSDTRGHGKSSVTPGPYTIDQLAKDVLTLADSQHFERFHFCGLSMGGQIGMWLAANAPQGLNKVILCSTAAKIGGPEMWDARIATVLKEGMKNVAAAAIERWFTPSFRAKNPSVIAHIQKVLETTSPEGYAASCAGLRDFDFRDKLNNIRTSTLIISGTHDPATTPADGHFLADRIGGARYVELNGAHLSNIEDADRFTREVLSFLNP
ncbi:MAG TPA: 3-oxoadipate enol-lactonase [Candidatus Bathyarchaeia archaeon]|nr:3-oxoadipate enol-lactonase [Candidatus Bathyarchaeia archaeon]